MFSLNPQSGIPIYRQIIEQIKRLIASGQLQSGDQLPSVRELALTHTVNPMTISKAYSLLEAEGLLDRQRGKGMLISNKQIKKENKKDRLQRLQTSVDLLVMAAAQLELDSEDVTQSIRAAMEKNND
jgi:GntR family transcriptional regulator